MDDQTNQGGGNPAWNPGVPPVQAPDPTQAPPVEPTVPTPPPVPPAEPATPPADPGVGGGNPVQPGGWTPPTGDQGTNQGGTV